MDNLLSPWYSIDWFTISTFRAFTWENNFFLYLILAVPFVFVIRWFIRYFLNQKLPVALIKSDLKSSPINWLRFIPELILMVVLSLLLVAMARPQKTNEKVEQWTEGIDIMIALDISQSMQIEDFQPNRLEAAKQVARDFIKGRLQDRIGLVVFSGDAFS